MTLHEDLNLLAFRDRVRAELEPGSVGSFRAAVIAAAGALEEASRRPEDVYEQASRELLEKTKEQDTYWSDLKAATAESTIFKVEDQYVVPGESARPPPPAPAAVYDY